MGTVAFKDAKRRDAYAFEPDKLWVIGVDTDDGPGHPLYDPRVELCVEGDEEFEALIASVIRHGIIQPIQVVRADDGDPIVVAGRRRVLAARVANTRGASVLVPGVRMVGDPIEQFERMVAENELRVEDSPMQKAAKLCRYFDLDASKTDADAAAVFGVTTQTIRNWKRLLELSPKVRAAVESEEIAPTAAGKLAALSYEEQDAKLDEMLTSRPEGKRATVKDAEASAGDRPRAPAKRFLLQLLEAEGEDPSHLSEDFLEGVAYAIGERPPEKVHGLGDAIAAMRGEQ